MPKTALICGASGQDGAYLTRLLLSKGYTVHGASRDAQTASFGNLAALGVLDGIARESVTITDFRSVLQALRRVRPDEVYNLAGRTSVGLPFEQPVETLESITLGTLNLPEAIRFTGDPIRFYSAGPSEPFGDTGSAPASERTAFRPRSPYAAAKAAAFWEVANYREAYDLFACTGGLFNHESPLRPRHFVTRKIVATAARIAAGSGERLALGNIGIRRDRGWAPEYVEAMWMMLQQHSPDDCVIATGETRALSDSVAAAFGRVGLDWEEHVDLDPALLCPTDIAEGRADPGKARERLGWCARHRMDAVVAFMVDAERGAGAGG